MLRLCETRIKAPSASILLILETGGGITDIRH